MKGEAKRYPYPFLYYLAETGLECSECDYPLLISKYGKARCAKHLGSSDNIQGFPLRLQITDCRLCFDDDCKNVEVWCSQCDNDRGRWSHQNIINRLNTQKEIK